MNVLVTGGTGFVGRYLCNELVERGHDVRTMDRSPDAGVVPDEVETMSGDVTEPKDVERALQDQEAVINLVALSPLFEPKGGNEMHERVHLGGTRTLVNLAMENDVDRFVQQSALGADPYGPTAYLRTKGQAEEVVRESSLDWTIVRPSIIFGEGGEFVKFTMKLTTPYVTGLPGGGKTPFQPIYVEDFVPILADCVEGDEHVGETYEIGGPEVLTMGEVAKLGHRSKGRSLSIVPVPMPLAGIGLKAAGMIPLVPFGGDQYRSLKVNNTVKQNDVEVFGIDKNELTTLAEYLGLENRQTASPSVAQPASN